MAQNGWNFGSENSAPGTLAPDGGAAEPEPLHPVHELLHGQVRILQGHRGKGHEAIRVRRAELGEPFVLDPDHLGRQVALRPVPRRVDAERLHVDALRVHLADAPGPDLVDARAPLGVRRQAQQGVRLRDHAVGVDVDRPHATAADDDFAAARGAARPSSLARPLAARAGRSRAPLPPRGRPRPGPRGGPEQIAPGEDDAGHRAGGPPVERFPSSHQVPLGTVFAGSAAHHSAFAQSLS